MISAEAIAKAAKQLARGELVAFPTETVYGLGADARQPDAVAQIFARKARPRFDPLIVHLKNREAANAYADTRDPRFWRLSERFWPGPLSLILPKKASIPDLVTAGHPSVALRVPRHPIAQALLEAFDGPIAAPSANRFGCVSPTCAEAVSEQLGSDLTVLDGGPAEVGLESTIVSLLGETPELLRPGGIPEEEIEAVIGKIHRPGEEELQSLSPGRQKRHYATQTPLYFWGDRGAPEPASDVGELHFGKPDRPSSPGPVRQLSQAGDPKEAAARLFQAMRELDKLDLRAILADKLPETGIGTAVMDRLRRAQAAASDEGEITCS